MRLNLPDYVVDANVLEAVRRDNVGYLKGRVTRDPCCLAYLYFAKTAIGTPGRPTRARRRLEYAGRMGLFEGALRAPVHLVLPLLGYALLFQTPRILHYLLMQQKRLEAVEQTGYLADGERLEPPGGRRYRVLTFPLQALMLPDNAFFRLTQNHAGLLVSAGQRVSVTRHDDQLAANGDGDGQICQSHVFQNAWHLAWQYYRPMREDAQELCRLTTAYLWHNVEPTGLIRKVWLYRLFVDRFSYQPSGLTFAEPAKKQLAYSLMLSLLVFGCRLEEAKTHYNVFKGLMALLTSSESDKEMQSRIHNLCLGFFALLPSLRGFARAKLEVIPLLVDLLAHPSLDNLAAKCVRAIRDLLTGRNLARAVMSLWLNEEVEAQILTGSRGNDARGSLLFSQLKSHAKMEFGCRMKS
ncbi:unnamed protein product [Protopolystoma xenopodis]|uniref:Uncharacterized protein n=1 Tax=Protopolystoma xenopodis TaxID=117903 RepID=A0A3S4ZDR0_9PLAT|nr:unnamed protein product [Protopolystoma xenopodis]